MKRKDQVIEDLYKIYFNGKTTKASDDVIEREIVVYMSKLSKFEVSCLNEYCGLDNINTNVERLALKLMSKFYDRFEDEKNTNIAKATIIKEEAHFFKKASGKTMILSYLGFIAGIIITMFMTKNGDTTGLSPTYIFLIYLSVSSFFYLMIQIALRINLIIAIIAFFVSLIIISKHGGLENTNNLIIVSVIAIIILLIDTITFIINNKKSKETDKILDAYIEGVDNDYRISADKIKNIENRK